MRQAKHHVVSAHDGWRLVVDEVAPRGEPMGVAIVGHAMMVDQRTVYRGDRPSLAAAFAAAGFVVLVPHLRGHGESGPGAAQGGSWRYEDLVADVGAYLGLARALAPQLPVVLVGNSLFGHLALAYLGRESAPEVVAIVGFAVCIWNRSWTASTWRWRVKRVLIAASHEIVARVGRLPVRQLRLGTSDEPRGYWESTVRWMRDGGWHSGGSDHALALRNVAVPVLLVVSDGDRLLAHPDDAILFTAALPRREVLRLGRGSSVDALRGLVPGHVEMVASPRCAPLWRHVAHWAHTVALRHQRPAPSHPRRGAGGLDGH
jgi:predicted alpha/beta hydrolase